MRLRSPWFVGRQPRIFAAGETLSSSRVDDSTLLVTLPRGPSGMVTLSVARGAGADSVAAVRRYGLRERRDVTPGLTGQLVTADSAGVPMIMGSLADQAAEWWLPIGRLNPTTGQGVTLTGFRAPSNPPYGVNPGTHGGFVVRDAWDSLKVATLLTSPPAFVRPFPFRTNQGFVRQVSELSPGTWLFTSHHESWTRYEADSLAQPYFGRAESPWSLFRSPRGDRTTMTVSAVITSVPVFDNQSGDTAFSLRLRSAEGIAFSADGARLFAVGRDPFDYLPTLIVVDATTGAALAPKVRLPEGYFAFSLAHYAPGDRLLVAVAYPAPLELLVYDATTLTLVGVLETGYDCGPAPIFLHCWEGVVAAHAGSGAAYIAVRGSPTPIWTFDLLPP